MKALLPNSVVMMVSNHHFQCDRSRCPHFTGKMILSVGIIENPSKNFAANDKRHGPTKFSHDEGKSNELVSRLVNHL